ncbi:MAG: alanyl-tRNA editing protein [Polyangiaceae bacterium]
MRLEQQDSYLRTFDARVKAIGTFEGRPSLILEASAFYPESGGQLGDTGHVGDTRIIDVQQDEAGTVHHLFEGAALEVGRNYSAEIDWERRREHMALHTGQHMLSKALLDVAKAETVSSRLGATDCTIDVSRADLGERWLDEAQALVNEVIDAARPVRAWLPTAAELAELRLRRAPKVSDGIRVVSVEGFDDTPCGGTHVSNTAEVGLVWVTGSERYKGGTRIHFSAGPRARRELFERAQLLGTMASARSIGVADVPSALERSEQGFRDARQEAGLLRARLADALVQGVKWEGARAVVSLESELELGRSLCERLLQQRPDAEVFLAVSVPDKQAVQVMIARASGSSLDAGATFKLLAAALGGRGGGKPERAEGRFDSAFGWDLARRECPTVFGG